jgi:hemerythrin-like domain-containing protein
MQTLAQLDHDHAVLDAAINHFDALLQRPRQAHAGDVQAVLGTLIRQLTEHLQFEEASFYLPLQMSGHARPDTVTRLLAEHEDLRETLRQLARFRTDPRLLHDEHFLLYSAHLLDLYREHSNREDQWLFPALEQLPPVSFRQEAEISRVVTADGVKSTRF